MPEGEVVAVEAVQDQVVVVVVLQEEEPQRLHLQHAEAPVIITEAMVVQD